MNLEYEVFALRDNETIKLTDYKPTDGTVLAVQARSCSFPPGAFEETSASGLPVEKAAIIACQWMQRQQKWFWIHLASVSKERIGDMLFDSGAALDTWYYLSILPSPTTTEKGE